VKPRVALPWRVLAKPLTARERSALERDLRALLSWQRDLARWPRIEDAPDAVPFVSLYARGRLVGCMGSDEGAPSERLARAFLRALSDTRFGSTRPADREVLTAEVSYMVDAWALDREDAEAQLEPGVHGVGVLRDDGAPVILLPEVACERRLDVPGMLGVLARKAGLTAVPPRLFAFATTRAVGRMNAPRVTAGSPADEAATWLACRVAADGAMTFAVDARAGDDARVGAMFHGRVAVALRALERHGGHPRAASRARRRLERDVAGALAGRRVEGWPEHPAAIAGTLALVALSGVDVRAPLLAMARARPQIADVPWHAAQVVAALGTAAPSSLWAACLRDLEAKPWAPWTAIAARARDEPATLERTLPTLVASVREDEPNRGGADVTKIPELALTAIALEAIAPARTKEARAALARGRAFLRRWQVRADGVPARFEPRLAAGAFPASPVAELFRVDVTGHALMALAAPELGRNPPE
jgi:AMMECR1 domain-containing protein